MGLLGRIVLAIVVGVAVWLVCIFAGMILVTLEASFAVAAGGFLAHYAGVIGALAALWFFFTGGGSSWSWPWKGTP